MADQYNRQLHPNEIPLLEKQSASLAQEANISPAEAEKRLAQALAYYTDKNWNGALAENGVVPDAVTLKHLGIALSPLADTYAAVGDVPVAAGSKSYTPAETVALITDYRNTHTAEYADASINAVNMQGLYAGDPGYKYANFYQKNLAVNTDFLSSLSGTLAGIAQGSGSALSDSFGSAWALMSDPAGVSEQAANGLMGLSKNPWGSFMNSVEASQTKEAMATIYDMQGNTAASAAIRAKSDLEFALNFLPANRAKTLAELGGGARALVSAEKAALPAGYREGGSVGAAFNETGGLPEGYRRVINTKTGNTEVLAADGTFYLETSNGLKPKAGGNLAGLVEAERNIASAKEAASEGLYATKTGKITIDGKIDGQLEARGWTQQEVQGVIDEGPVGTTADNRSASKTPDGLARNDPASVYGSKSGYVVVNDRTGEVVQISGKNDPGWIPDSRIKWK
ncbi:colicin E5-related ribonuclease [Pseudomonas sp. MWU16-30316]